MKLLKFGDEGLTLQAESQTDVVWLMRTGMHVEVKGQNVEAVIPVNGGVTPPTSMPKPPRTAKTVASKSRAPQASPQQALEEARKFQALQVQGLSHDAIAKQFGIGATTVKRRLWLLNPPKKHRAYDYTKQPLTMDQQRILDLLNKGFAPNQVASQLNLPGGASLGPTIGKFKRMGLYHPKGEAQPVSAELGASSVATGSGAPQASACPVPGCPKNRGGKSHYHLSPEGKAKRVAAYRSYLERRDGPKAEAAPRETSPGSVSEPGTPSPGFEPPPASGTVSKAPEPKTEAWRPDAAELAAALNEPDTVVLEFKVNPNGRRVARLPTGKVAMVEFGFRETVFAGEKWLCKLQHFDTYAKAFPLKRVWDEAKSATEEPLAPVPIVHKEWVPRAPAHRKTGPASPPKPPRPDPHACPTCFRRLVLRPSGQWGHREGDWAYHYATARKLGVPA